MTRQSYLKLPSIADMLREKVQEAVRLTALQVHTELTEQTPVLTGLARFFWQAVDNKDVAISQDQLKVMQKALRAGSRLGTNRQAKTNIQNWEGGESLFIVNGLPYIQSLNDGSSAKAPQGFDAIFKGSRGVLKQNLKKVLR